MCEALDKVENRGIQIGEKRGEKKGRIKTLYELVTDGILTLQQAADRMGMTESKFKVAFIEILVAHILTSNRKFSE